jgi:hypothetical protein
VIRRTDWPERLDAYLVERFASRFQWGSVDCCLFAADALLAMTDTDIAAWFRGRYGNAASAYRALRQFAGHGVEATFAKLAHEHGWHDVEIVLAQRGDVALFRSIMIEDAPFDCGVGIVIGDKMVALGEDGMIAMPVRSAFRTWHV